MKISDESRFPHPVLNDLTGDYTGGQFSFVIQEISEIWEKGLVEIHFVFKILEESILDLIKTNRAGIGLFITCLETYYQELKVMDLEKTVISFPNGSLHGSVKARPFVWADEKIENFFSKNLHSDYADKRHQFTKGAIIAIGEEVTFSAGRQKHAKLKTIFNLSKNDEIPKNETRVYAEGEIISIQAPSDTYSNIHRLRNTAIGKDVLLNSVYLPAIMEVLSLLPNEVLEEKRWYRTFIAKCESLGIDPGSDDLIKDAQQLLKSPFNRIENNKNILSND